MVKASRRKALTLLLGAALSSSVSGCVTTYAEGTEDFSKFCVERLPSPKPGRCLPQGGSSPSKDWLFFPYGWVSLDEILRRAREQVDVDQLAGN